MLLLWLGCDAAGPATDSDADTAEPADTDTATGPVSEAWAEIAGAPADALGNAVESAGDLDGDGAPDLLVSAYLGNRVCALFGPFGPGLAPLDELDAACFVGDSDLDYAGYGVAALDDVTGDGAPDVAVGSIGNTEAGANAGKVYLLRGPLSAGAQTLGDAALATWTGESAGDYAGIEVAAGGDLNGDELPDLLVGASGFDGEGGGGGRAYVLTGPFGAGARLLADAHASVTGLGDAVAVAPPHGAFGTGDFVGDALVGGFDFDGDGADDLAIGASGDASAGPSTGKAAVFFGPLEPGALGIDDADVTLLGEAEYTYTGSPVRGSGDLTGDGRDDLLVSADTLGAGAVYVTSPAVGQGSVVEATLRFAGEVSGDHFGYALSRTVDLDADGSLDLVVSAPSSDRVDFETGAVWAFVGPFGAGTIGVEAGRAINGATRAETFGSALDIGGDLDGDGGPDLAVGARNSDVNGGFSGAVYLFAL